MRFPSIHSGSAILLTTVLMLMSMLVVTILAGDLVRNGLIMVRVQNHSTKAYFAAEAGAEMILYNYYTNSTRQAEILSCSVGQCIRKMGTSFDCAPAGSCNTAQAFVELSNGTRFRIFKTSVSPLRISCEGFFGEAYNNNISKRVIRLDF